MSRGGAGSQEGAGSPAADSLLSTESVVCSMESQESGDRQCSTQGPGRDTTTLSSKHVYIVRTRHMWRNSHALETDV